jgi:hypothetical protein
MQFQHGLLLALFFASASCVTFKQFDDKARASREPGYEACIITKDGNVITGQTFKHRNYDPYDYNLVRVTNQSNAFTMDGKSYSDQDVVAFQDKKAFHKRFQDLFLILLAKGKINLYYFDKTGYDRTYNPSAGPGNIQRTNTRTTTYFFEKEKDKIIPIGLNELKEAVKDNPNALNKLRSYYPKESHSGELNVDKLAAVIEMYNQ